jgi:ketosteroid isomerase-like protein
MMRFAPCVFTLLAAGTASRPDAATEVARVLDAQYAAVESGDLAAWAVPLAEDVFLFGSDPKEATLGKSAVAAELGRAAAGRMAKDVKRAYRSTSGARVVGMAPGGNAAWVADEIDYRLDGPKRKATLHFRMTALLVREADGLRIVAADYAVPVPDEQAARNAYPPPRDFGRAVAPGAEALARLVDEWHGPGFAGLFSARPDVVLFGTAGEERVVGGLAVAKFVGQDRPNRTQAPKVVPSGGLVARVFDAGRVGFVAYNARLTVGLFKDIPVRVMDVLLKEKGGWRKVSEQVSVAVPD